MGGMLGLDIGIMLAGLLSRPKQGDTSLGGLGWVDFDLGCSKAGGPLL